MSRVDDAALAFGRDDIVSDSRDDVTQPDFGLMVIIWPAGFR
ncbi:MAG: hypothetical protein R3D05_17140 [Dongiaceae bacterium]